MMTKKSEHYQNSEYWEERIADETWKNYNNVEEQNRDLLQMYEDASANIKKELYSLAEKQKQGILSRTQQYRFDKLTGQQGKIIKEIEKLGDLIEKSQSERIKSAGKRVYENVMDSLGVDDFSQLNDKQMEQMLRSPWKGSFFSERLWGDMSTLEKHLNDSIKSGVETGKTVTEMAIDLSNTMNKSFNIAHRLVRTEAINTMNRSALRGYKDAGINKVQWWAAEDERTCDICGANHEKIYDVDKAPILPCHPGCRCTWLPVADDGFKKVDVMKIKENNQKKKLKSNNGAQKLITYAKEKLKIAEVDFDGLDYKATRNLLNTIADTYNKYPELENSIKKIIQTDSATMAVSIADNYEGYILAISNKLYANPTIAQTAINKSIVSGLYAKGTSLATIPYHEFGHIFEGLYINNHYANEDKVAAWDNCIAAKSVLEQASIKCYNDENRFKEELKNISSYALYSDSEGLAECLHMEMTGRGSVFTAIVMKILRGENYE